MCVQHGKKLPGSKSKYNMDDKWGKSDTTIIKKFIEFFNSELGSDITDQEGEEASSEDSLDDFEKFHDAIPSDFIDDSDNSNDNDDDIEMKDVSKITTSSGSSNLIETKMATTLIIHYIFFNFFTIMIIIFVRL